MKALAKLNKAQELTKTLQESVAQRMVEELISEEDALTAYVKIKALNEITSKILKNEDFKETYLDELDKYSGEELERLGAKLGKAATGAKFDFSKNAKWAAIDKTIKTLTEERKKLEGALKAMYEAQVTGVDLETGEVLEGVTKIHTGSEVPKITFNK